MNFKNLSPKIIISVAVIAASFIDAHAISNEKFFKKAAEQVWSSNSEIFQSALEAADSLTSDKPAVILVDYNYISADREVDSNHLRTTNRSLRTTYNRRMVKIFDKSAAEYFSEFEFGGKHTIYSTFRSPLSELESAFGCRIHKPNGELINVDINTALPLTIGKKEDKDKAKSYKIAIPNLEPGDVIEYFNYYDEWRDEASLPPIQLRFLAKYPIINFIAEGTFSPEITVECRSYNGAPSFTQTTDNKGRSIAQLHAVNIPVIEDSHGVKTTRQLPFIQLYTFNNTSKYIYRPKTSRRGGFYSNIPSGTISQDIRLAIAGAEYESSFMPRKMHALANDYIKSHPDATTKEKIEGAWLASLYVATTDENTVDDFWLSVMFKDMLDKLKLTDAATGVGYINSRNEVPADEILYWKQPEYAATVGDSLFLASTMLNYLPGELPGDYQGEKALSYTGKRTALASLTAPRPIQTPPGKPSQNCIAIKINASITDDNSLQADHDITLSGSEKGLASEFNGVNSWILEVEDYLGIPKNKRQKKINPDDDLKLTENTNNLIKSIFKDKPTQLNGIEVTSRGFLPSSPHFNLKFSGRHNNLITHAGNEIIVAIGQLTADSYRFEGNERNRTLDYYHSAPHQMRYDITLTIPEGYIVDDASLAKLNTNRSTIPGVFFSKAETDQNGNVRLQVGERYKNSITPVEQWDQLLNLFDAAAEFNDVIIILQKK